MTTNKLKQMIIENFIIFACHTEEERTRFNGLLTDYMVSEDEGEYNELLSGLAIHEDSIGIHTNCQNCGASTNL